MPVIEELHPSYQVFHGAITARTLENYVFCHLVTEAVATVGLDYGFLGNRRLDERSRSAATSERCLSIVTTRCFPSIGGFPDLQIQQPEFVRRAERPDRAAPRVRRPGRGLRSFAGRAAGRRPCDIHRMPVRRHGSLAVAVARAVACAGDAVEVRREVASWSVTSIDA